MPEVFLCEIGQLTATSKRELRKAGIVVAEVADISKAQFIRSAEAVSGDDMLWAAFDALRVESGNYGRDNRERLAFNLAKITTDAYKKRTQTEPL